MVKTGNRPLDSGRVLDLRMNEGAGFIAHDVSGQRNHGVLGAGAAAPTWVAGGGLDFDGGDKVEVADNAVFDVGGALTVAHKFKTSTNQSFIRMVRHDLSAQKYTTYLTSDSGQLIFYVLLNGVSFGATSGDLGDGYFADGVIHHFVGTFDRTLASNRVKLYLDGELLGQINGTDFDIDAGDEGIDIGNLFTGILDEILIYNRDLSAEEIKLLYASRGRQ